MATTHMKILALNASHRGDLGQTHNLIDRLFAGAREAGADCEELLLARYKIQRCLSCGECRTPQRYLHCVYSEKDDVAAIFDRMRAADLLIFATPVYVFNMSGLLKTLLDRIYGTGDVDDLRVTRSGLMFHHIDAALCSKPFVVLVCCDNLEAEITRSVTTYFRIYARFMDAPQVGELVRNAGRLFGHGRAGEAAALPKIQQVYAAYRQAGRELAALGRIQAATQRRANQEIIPLPGFGLIKRLPFRAVKEKFIQQANKFKQAADI